MRIGCREAASLWALERQPPSPPRLAISSNAHHFSLKRWMLQAAMGSDCEGSTAPGRPAASTAVPPPPQNALPVSPRLHEKTMAALWQLRLQDVEQEGPPACCPARTLVPRGATGMRRHSRHALTAPRPQAAGSRDPEAERGLYLDAAGALWPGTGAAGCCWPRCWPCCVACQLWLLHPAVVLVLVGPAAAPLPTPCAHWH